MELTVRLDLLSLVRVRRKISLPQANIVTRLPFMSGHSIEATEASMSEASGSTVRRQGAVGAQTRLV